MKLWPECLPRSGNSQLKQIQSISQWFQIFEINKDTYAIYEPFHIEETISYLIIGEQKSVLFDSGMGIANIKSEVENLTSKPTIVVNSHSHFDHIGGNCNFDEIWCFNHNWEINNIQQGYSVDYCKEFMQPEHYLNLPKNFNSQKYAISPSRITKTLNDGEIINLGNRDLIVHHTPGESPGAITLQDTFHNMLFIGDLFLLGGSIWTHLEESDFFEHYNSLQILSKLRNQIDIVCPAHNEILIDPVWIDEGVEAFLKIKNNLIEPKIENNAQVYSFKDFKIITSK